MNADTERLLGAVKVAAEELRSMIRNLGPAAEGVKARKSELNELALQAVAELQPDERREFCCYLYWR